MRNNKNVLLLQAPFNEFLFGDQWKPFESLFAPVGLLYIASPILKSGYNVSFIDLNVEHFTEKDFYDVVKRQFFILISIYNHSVKNTIKIIKETRKIHNNAIIICGGPYCNVSKEYFEGSDVTCIGEAENYITDIMENIEEKKSLNNIPGLFYKENGQIINTRGIMKAGNLDQSLPPALEITKGKDYGYICNMKVNAAPLLSSRGCPFSCHYCSYRGFGYRSRSVDNVIAEIKDIVKKGYEYIVFCDDNFLANKRRVHKIMDRIIEEKIKVKMFVSSRVDSTDYQLFKKLRKAGVLEIIFGVESYNQDILDFYNKKVKVEQIKKAIHLAHKAGLVVGGTFMVGAPFESKKHLTNNKKFFDTTPVDLMTMSILYYEKGTRLWDDLYKKGIVNTKDCVVLNNEKLSLYTYGEWEEIKSNLVKHFYSNPLRILRMIFKFLKLGQLSLVLNFVKHNNHKTLLNFFSAFGKDARLSN